VSQLNNEQGVDL